MSLAVKIRSRLDTIKKHQWGLLDLRNCGLTEIPEEVFSYDCLVNIDLGNDSYCDDISRNKIKVIPDSIAQLKNLSRLNLSDNEVSKLSEKIAALKGLEYLDLSNNFLTDFSPKIANMASLKHLNLENNPFDMLPPEIIARGIDSIRNFFIELEETDFLYEAKLLIVGQGRVGKTCTSKALIDPNFKLSHEESTEGININRWVINKEDIQKFNPKIQRDLQINIWDFGGQEIYHSTHQFFLTKRSMYMLVTESRKEDSHDDFYYWLNVIKLLGDQSPVFMVLNKCDQPTKELPIKEYKETFGNIVDFEKISLKEGYEETVQNFKGKLTNIASNLPHIGTPLPKKWVDIRIEIEQLKLAGKNYISETEYLEICKKHYRRTQSALFLSEYFHDLGVLLHFQDDLDLKDMVVVNHEWITKGVYKLLDDHEVIAKKGQFNLEDLKRVWHETEYRNKTRELLSLMKNRKFDLCFELPNGEFLIPRLLPVDEIEHNWNSLADDLKYELHYKFMPKGIITRLIVKMNQDIYKNQYWRYGVLLEHMDTKALIRERYFENKITIEIKGNYKREFLWIIRKSLNEIHKDFNKIIYDEMIPCNCSTCKTLEKPFFFAYNLLLRYEHKNKDNIVCEISLDEVNVLGLTQNIIRDRLSNEVTFICENSTASLLQLAGFTNIKFFAEKDNTGVYIKVATRPDVYGLRDRDFLIDAEIENLKKKHPNYKILEYYCIENYLFHPENISELQLDGFKKDLYIKELVSQKNKNKSEIISIFKKSRDSYQEFKVDKDKFRMKDLESEIIRYLDSDEVETFLKAYSLKSWFDKSIIDKYNLKHIELAKTEWFKNKLLKIVNI